MPIFQIIMSKRKKIIEEVINNFQVMKNKMHAKTMVSGNHAITNSQWCVLDIIDRNDNISIKEVSSILSISPSATTQLVNLLEVNNYVVRYVDPSDRRELNLTLSKNGKKHIVSIRKKHVAIVEELFYALNEKELKEYLKLQTKIISGLRPTA